MEYMDLRFPDLKEKVENDAYGFTTCWTVTHPDAPADEEDIAAALIKAHGSIADAGVVLRRSRTELARMISKSAYLSSMQVELLDSSLDRIEALQITRALSGDVQAGQFILRTLGKDRGFSTRQDLSSEDGTMTPKPAFDVTKLSTEALAEIVDASNASESSDD